MPWSLDQAEEYLLGLELFGMRFGLDRMHRLTTALGMPQRRFASIHVVGSNGKSSTVRFLAAILERHGLRTGSYTSPHLASFTERVEVGEQPVSSSRFAAAVQRAARAAAIVERAQGDGGDPVTQFEALTAAAYHELAAQKVEVAVIEAGLGGRYDATNVIPSRVSVLTGVGLEHTRWLGPTVRDIAEEKLAVVRDHSTLVTGPLDPQAEAVADRVVAERHATWVRSPAPPATPLWAAGEFQRQNFALANAGAQALLGRPLDPDAVADAAARTRIPGRLDPVRGPWPRRFPACSARAGPPSWWPACWRTRTRRPCSKPCSGSSPRWCSRAARTPVRCRRRRSSPCRRPSMARRCAPCPIRGTRSRWPAPSPEMPGPWWSRDPST